MEQLTTLPQLGDPGAMEPWALPAWQCWTQGQGFKPGDAAPSMAVTRTPLQVRGLRSEESSEPEGALSPGPVGNTDPEGTETGLPKLGQQAESPGHSCSGLEDGETQACKAKPTVGFGVRSNLELLRALGELQHRCTILKEENQMLRKSSFPETEEKVRRLKRKNAELAVIAKRLEERAQKLQETNMRVVSAPVPRPGSGLELCRKALARQRARDLSETASALLAKDKQIAALQRECRELQARLTLVGKEGPQWLHVRDFDRLLRESQREVLRLQRQIALRNQREPLRPARSPGPTALSRVGAPAPGAPGEAILQDDVDSPQVVLGEPERQQRVQQLESELSKKRKKCESLEQEARKKQRRCEELELQLRAAQNENALLVEENSRLSGRAAEKEQVEWENAELKGQLRGVKQERDSALRKSQGLQSKLESLEQVLKHMREVAQRRQQLEVEHEQARLSLQEKQEEVRRLQQAQAEARREHEGAVQLLESTLDSMQARVRELEGQCRSQTERFSLLAQELQAFRLHPGPLDLLTSALGCGALGDRPPPHCCCSTPQPCQGSGPKDLDLPPGSPGRCTPKSSEPALANPTGVPRRTAKKVESLSNSSRSESIHNSPKSCPTPEVDTASEVEELEVDSVSLLPAAPEGPSGGARIQVFLARYSYNPLEGPNENPEAELPLTAGEYIYIYGDMDEDGFFEGELMDGRRGLVPSNFVERVSDDDLLTSLPRELADLSHSSGPELSFLSGGGGGCSSGGQSSGGRSQPRPEEEAAGDELSLSPPPEGLGESLAVPYPRHLTVLKQLAHSVVLAWELPPERVDLRGFHIFVNGELRQALGPGVPPKAVLENMDLRAGPLHVSVQALTSRGSSDPLRCCLAVGAGAGVVPSQLRVHRLTATTAEITWVPGNSNLAHAIYLNGEECPPARPSTYWATFGHLRPGTLYQARVEAQIPSQGPWEPGWERPEQRAATLQFTTLPAGLPDAPLDVQVEPGPSPGILMISWLPVTIDAAGTSNGVRVTGYTIYADGQKIMEVASPTAGSVLVEVSQLQLLQACHEVTVRTTSPHGESTDSIPAPVAPALAPACQPARMSCLSPRPSPEARTALASVSPGLGDPSFPLRHPAPAGSQDSPASLPTEMSKASQEEPPAPCSQEESGAAVQGTSEEKRAIEPTLGREGPGPLAPSLAKQEVEWTSGETGPMPCSTQGEPAQKVPSTEACHGGDLGSGLKLRAEKEDMSELGVRLVNSLVDHGRNSDLSDIQEEEEEEEEEEELGSRPCSPQKQVAGNSVRENGAKPQPDPLCETDSEEEILEQILELPVQRLSRKKLFSIPEEEEEEEEEEEGQEKSEPGSSSQDPSQPELALLGPDGDSSQPQGPGPSPLSPEPSGAREHLEDVLGVAGGNSRRRGGSSPEKPPSRKRPQDPREHCSRLLGNGGPQTTARPGPPRERGSLPVIEGIRVGQEAGGRGRPGLSRRCPRGPAPESSLVSCLSPKCLEISIEYDSEDEQEAGSGGIGITSSCYPTDGESWGTAAVGRSRGPLKVNSGSNPYLRLPAWEKGEPERRGRCAAGRTKEPPSRVCAHFPLWAAPPACCRLVALLAAHQPLPFHAATSISRGGAGPLGSLTCLPPPTFHCSLLLLNGTGMHNILLLLAITCHLGQGGPFLRVASFIFRTPDCDAISRESPALMPVGDCPLAFSLAPSGPRFCTHLLGTRGLLPALLPLWGCLVLSEAGPGPWRGMLCSCSAVLLTLTPGPEPGHVGHRGDGGSPLPSAALSLQATETGESRGKDNSGRRGPQRRGARVPRPGTTELAPPRSPPEAPAHQNLPVRVFVALFDYDPVSMSPNPDAGEEELPFREGQILKVFGDKDSDGFYRGQSGGRIGFIPCNMVAEVAVDSAAGRQQLLQRGFLPPDVLTEGSGNGPSVYSSAHMTGPPPKPRRSKKAELEGPQPCPGPPKLPHSAVLKTSRPMVAAFDYNPRENSPNMDVEAELPFRAGDVITVFGNMDDDGFYYGELNGQRGLVPSNFLESPGPESDGLESGTSQAESQRTRRRRDQC